MIEYKTIIIISILIAYGGTYFVTSYFPLYKPARMPKLSIDHKIKFVPEWILLYISFYPQLFLGLYLTPNNTVFKTMCFAYVLCIVFCTLTYLFYPTSFPVKIKDLIKEVGFVFSQKGILQKIKIICLDIVKFIKRIDKPHNCCPSSHVTLSMVIGIVFLIAGYYFWGIIFLIWGIGISISTLTVKQHAFIDFVAGVTLSLICAITSSIFI